jgi:hypothetical protein
MAIEGENFDGIPRRFLQENLRHGIEFTATLGTGTQFVRTKPGENLEDAAARFYRNRKKYPRAQARLAAELLMKKFQEERYVSVEDLEKKQRGMTLTFAYDFVSIQMDPSLDKAYVVHFPKELAGKRVQAATQREVFENTGSHLEDLSDEVAMISRFKELCKDWEGLKKQLGVPENMKLSARNPGERQADGFYYSSMNLVKADGYLEGRYLLGINPQTGEVRVKNSAGEVIREAAFSDREPRILGMKGMYSVEDLPEQMDLPGVEREPPFVRAKRKLTEMLRRFLAGKRVVRAVDASNPYFDMAAYQIDLEGGKRVYFSAQPKSSFGEGGLGMAFRMAEGGMTGEPIVNWTSNELDIQDGIDRLA